MESRYALLLKPGARYDSANDDDDEGRESQEYAQFLKEKERKCCRDGFVDSSRQQHNFQKKEKKKEKEREKEQQQKMTVVDLSAKKEKDQKDYEKRLNTIEDHMWQHKQDNRELKRTEGDIIKNQRLIRRSLRDYENAITRKRMTEEKKMNQGLEKYNAIQQHHRYKKEEVTKQRLEANLSSEQAHKDLGRRVQLTTCDLARQYRTKMTLMDLKRLEVERLNKDFEAKLRAKEEEQYRLKQELAELAITLNMEAQKGRTQEVSHNKEQKKEQQKKIDDDKSSEQDLENKLGRSDNDTKAAEQGRRKLSADLTLTRAHMQLKQREEERHRKDTGNQLRENIAVQKQLNEAAIYAEMDHKNKQINQKVQEHNQRRTVLATQAMRGRKENSAQHETVFTEKAQKRHLEQQRREHEDHLKHFQKAVQKGEDTEYNLYNSVKNAEYNRQKHEQSVRHLNNELQEIRRSNARELQAQMHQATKKEQDLQQSLIRAQANLAKVHAEREDSYTQLQKHREMLRADKYLLEEHEREHKRLTRVGQRAETSH